MRKLADAGLLTVTLCSFDAGLPLHDQGTESDQERLNESTIDLNRVTFVGLPAPLAILKLVPAPESGGLYTTIIALHCILVVYLISSNSSNSLICALGFGSLSYLPDGLKFTSEL